MVYRRRGTNSQAGTGVDANPVNLIDLTDTNQYIHPYSRQLPPSDAGSVAAGSYIHPFGVYDSLADDQESNAPPYDYAYNNVQQPLPPVADEDVDIGSINTYQGLPDDHDVQPPYARIGQNSSPQQ